MLLGMVVGRRRSAILGFPEEMVSIAANEHFRSVIAARHGGVPLAYLTGHKEFYSLELDVSRDTLVPRPETELLVDLALSQLAPVSEARVLDLGTGCGAIALSLRRERPRIHITAVDVSPAA
ncbi:MAG: methyltransferase, partial [Planctomycetaceae bacterium]